MQCVICKAAKLLSELQVQIRVMQQEITEHGHYAVWMSAQSD